MRFELDENLPQDVARLLASGGHDAVSVIDRRLGGGPDAGVARACRAENRVLLTLDVDFADILAFPPAEQPGIVVLRLQRQDKQHVLDVVGRLLPLLGAESVAGRVWIVEESRIRIRGD